MDNLQDIIAQHPFFKDLDPQHMPELAEGAQRVLFPVGEVLAREGDEAHRFYLILKGRVAIEALIPAQGQVAFQNVGSGDALGWSWLFPPYRWHFSAKTVEETDVVMWETAVLRAKAEVNPKFGYELACRMTRVLLQRLHATHQQLVEFYGSPG